MGLGSVSWDTLIPAGVNIVVVLLVDAWPAVSDMPIYDGFSDVLPGPWRGGDTGDKVKGPGALADFRGAREDKIMRIKWGPAKAKSDAPEGLRKVEYSRDPAISLL
jgi:hypothetical protein